MSDDNWFRNTVWNDEIAARFESRLARSRTQKAQYLLIQGTMLIASQPEVAACLFEKSIALNDESHLARAQNGLAMARMALGEIDACLAAFEGALETEIRLPSIRTSALADYVFAIAWHQRSERYEIANEILAAAKPSPFPGTDLQLDAARALIASCCGRNADAKRLAEAALAQLSAFGALANPDIAFCGISPTELTRRLQAVAGV